MKDNKSESTITQLLEGYFKLTTEEKMVFKIAIGFRVHPSRKKLNRIEEVRKKFIEDHNKNLEKLTRKRK